MQSPLSLELYAHDVMRQRLHQAAQDALAAQLPGTRLSIPRPDLAARLHVASGLRALAFQLDPCSAAYEPALGVVSPR